MVDPSSSAPTELKLLGRFELRTTGRSLNVSAMGGRVLALLALNRDPVARHVAAALLWPESSRSHASANLRTTLWRLRERGKFVVASDCSILALDPTVDVDVQHAVAQARQLMQPGPVSVLPADIHLDGDLLPGWYDDWILLERERLHQLRLNALEALARRLTESGRAAEAADVAYRAITLEPLRDSARCALVHALLSEGNNREALQMYRDFRRLLSVEMGVAPSRRLQGLIKQAYPGDQLVSDPTLPGL